MPDRPTQACVELVYTTPPKLVFGRDRDHLTTYLQPNLNFKSTTSIECSTVLFNSKFALTDNTRIENSPRDR